MVDFGRITPAGSGRWKWPLSQMKIGDSFWVSAKDRHPALVRKLVYDRGHALKRSFSVNVRGDKVFVKRVEPAATRSRCVDQSYKAARDAIQESYGIDIGTVPWDSIECGRSLTFHQERIAKPFAEEFDVTVDHRRYRLLLNSEGLTVEHELTVDELMS